LGAHCSSKRSREITARKADDLKGKIAGGIAATNSHLQRVEAGARLKEKKNSEGRGKTSGEDF